MTASPRRLYLAGYIWECFHNMPRIVQILGARAANRIMLPKVYVRYTWTLPLPSVELSFEKPY